MDAAIQLFRRYLGRRMRHASARVAPRRFLRLVELEVTAVESLCSATSVENASEAFLLHCLNAASKANFESTNPSTKLSN